MGNFNERLPKWENVGTEPPASKQTEGWQPQERPPAGWLNWLFNRSYKAIEELQEKAITMDEGGFASEQELQEHKTDNTAHDIDNKLQGAVDTAKGYTDSEIATIAQEVSAIENECNAHKADTANPHTVTKSQVGLGSVDNAKQIPMITQGTTTADPNTTLHGQILTNHSNSPNSAFYWYIQTYFYASLGEAVNACQIAIQYNGGNGIYIRNRYSAVWSAWTKLVNANGDAFTGIAVAQSNTSYTTRQLRNVIMSTADPSGGSNGDIWIKYK